MRVLITLPWAKHIEFLRERSARKRNRQDSAGGRERQCRSSAIFGYLVGNEIASTMVRWLGVRPRHRFCGEIDSNRTRDRSGCSLFLRHLSATEYLLPQNVDFFCFNVYLHNQRDFEKYLLRLQNLTEERPLILGEFRMDTIRHSQQEQAEMLGWHVDSVVKCGWPGTIFFTWTDEWFTGEQEIHRLGVWDRHARTRNRKKRSNRFGKNLAKTIPRCRIATYASTVCLCYCLFL